jgi:hypothetical protein
MYVATGSCWQKSTEPMHPMVRTVPVRYVPGTSLSKRCTIDASGRSRAARQGADHDAMVDGDTDYSTYRQTVVKR